MNDNEEDNNNSTQILQRVVRLEERTRIMQKKVDLIDDKIQQEFSSIEGKLDEIISLRDKLDGGWKVIAWVGGIIIFLSATVSWFFDRWEVIKNNIFN